MKKLIVLLILVAFTAASFSQGLFRPVQQDMFKSQLSAAKSLKTLSAIKWRLDATVAFIEFAYNKNTKQLVSSQFSAVGPAIGIQNFVPTSAIDPTPVNNWGISVATLFGPSIANPNMAAFKLALQLNIFQYFKFGGTYTPNTPSNIGHFGFFAGAGITF